MIDPTGTMTVIDPAGTMEMIQEICVGLESSILMMHGLRAGYPICVLRYDDKLVILISTNNILDGMSFLGAIVKNNIKKKYDASTKFFPRCRKKSSVYSL